MKLMEKVRAHIFISGRVQGIFFRKNTRQKAIELGIFGLVKNLSDGRVEAIFEGKKEQVKKMIEWAKKGPTLAQVENIEIKWQKPQNEFSDFEIKYN